MNESVAINQLIIKSVFPLVSDAAITLTFTKYENT